jgi:predicted secreted hydrolase
VAQRRLSRSFSKCLSRCQSKQTTITLDEKGMKVLLKVFIGLSIFTAIGMAAWLLFRSETPVTTRATVIGLDTSTGNSIENYARVYQPRDFAFPLDHGPHPEYQTEWWYYTGNLTDAGGRRFGYQLTFFRRALLPPAEMPLRQSDLASNEVYFAHFAVTDSAVDKHFAIEKFSRGAGGLAGASGAPYKVFVENWSAEGLNPQADVVHLAAQSGAYHLSLDLHSTKPIVKQGDHGFSAKSATAGNASYYYSFTRLETKGSLQTESGSYQVTGDSWMDHEWSTSALSSKAQGWDWFALQLSDRRELMFYQFRNMDGTIDPISGGTLVEPDGSTRPLKRDQVGILVKEHWSSQETNAQYPVSWVISIPDARITLQVDALIKDQQNKLSIVYWEGAVNITGQDDNGQIKGMGYIELTGYSGSLNGKF